MSATANIQAPVPAAGLGLYAPLRVAGTKSRRTDKGLAAYRSPVDGLATRFPVTRRVAGDESFDAMARRFMASERSAAAIRLHNCETFPNFLRNHGKAASIEYVADIAELEMARGKAHYAADILPIGARAFPSLRAERLRGLRLVLHPSAFLVASPFPIVTIWETNQSDEENGRVDRWCAESALVARPFLDIEVWRLPPGGYAFISALSQGRTIATAIDAGIAADPKFDIATNHALLIEANVVVGFRERARIGQLNA
jgi:Putative DNA-binding domain